MKNIIRKLTISELLGKDMLSPVEKEIVDFILNKITDLHQFKDDSYHGFIFYMNPNGECIFEIYDKSKLIFIRYDGFWKLLEEKYNFNYDEIQYLMKILIEKVYKLKDITTRTVITKYLDRIENVYKLKGITNYKTENIHEKHS